MSIDTTHGHSRFTMYSCRRITHDGLLPAAHDCPLGTFTDEKTALILHG
jgi:hypothetical protein